MIDIVIVNDRAYLNIFNFEYEHYKLFHKKNNTSNPLKKSASFKIYTGFVAKFLSFIGFASKFECHGIEEGKEFKTIYLNKKSFVKYQFRAVQASEQSSVDKKVDALRTCYIRKPDQIQSKVINYVNQNFNEIKKHCVSSNICYFSHDIQVEMMHKIESLRTATS